MSTVSSGCCRSHHHHNHKYLIHLLVPLSSLSRSTRSSSLYPTNQSSYTTDSIWVIACAMYPRVLTSLIRSY